MRDSQRVDTGDILPSPHRREVRFLSHRLRPVSTDQGFFGIRFAAVGRRRLDCGRRLRLLEAPWNSKGDRGTLADMAKTERPYRSAVASSTISREGVGNLSFIVT